MYTFSEIELKSRSTPSQIATALTELALDGRLKPGAPIRESVAATELGVSRNTVREAVRLLESSGLARYEMNRGVIIREPSEANVRDVYRARLAIEVGAVTTSPRNDDAGERVSTAMAELTRALDKHDSEAPVRADLDFHAALVAAAGSHRLDASFVPVLNELRLYLTILSRHGGYRDVSRLQSEHEQIAESFLNGSADAVAAAVSTHIEQNARRLIDLSRLFAQAGGLSASGLAELTG